MLDSKKILKVFLVIITITNFYVTDVSAEDASQALQQLQLLQKNMKAKNSGVESKLEQLAKQAKDKKETANKAVAQKHSKPSRTTKTKASEKSAAPTASKTEGDVIRFKAFERVKSRLFPLDTNQIVDLRRNFNKNERALITSVGTPPRPTATSQMVNLSPGATPPVIRLAQGFISSVVFLDSSGAPWPIIAYDIGDPEAFNIQWDKSGNTLLIQAKKLYNYGNLAVRLQGLNTPVMLTLIPGQRAVDYRVDMRVQGFGPNAKNLPNTMGLPNMASNELLKVLEGVPPANSSRLRVSGGAAEAWTLGDKMYVRTRLNILSPGWIGMMSSGDGTHAYQMMKAPVLLVSWHGKVVQLKLEGL